jgi:hypothetical protein
MTWKQIDRTYTSEGTTITYRCEDPKVPLVQSRKRHIPHANRGGTWDHTSYFVVFDGKDVAEKYTLKAAMEYAEKFTF